VKFNVAGNNFNPKHPLQYGWKTSGGNLEGANTSSVSVDTARMAAGSYTLSVTVTDPKLKAEGMASCSIPFLVKTPPAPAPPTVKCVPPETSIKPGEAATLSMESTNPDNRPLTYAWTATGGQLTPAGSSATLTPSNNDAGSTISVTGTVTDDRTLSATCNVTVTVPQLPPPCIRLVDWGECTFEKDPRRPWRVDNVCKDILDQLALKLQGTSIGTLVIVGYTDPSEAVKSASLGAQRAVNIKYYLVTDGPTKLDASRVQADDGGVGGKSARFYFVPNGLLCPGQDNLGTAVDSSKVRGQSRRTPAKKQAAQQ